jgi:hypothetical protein
VNTSHHKIEIPAYPCLLEQYSQQPRYPSIGEWIKKRWYRYIVEYYSAIKKNEVVTFA